MLHVADIMAALSTLLALAGVAVCLHKGFFRRYLLLNFYLLATALFDIGCFYYRTMYGEEAVQYVNFYYTWVPLPTIIAYVLIGWFSDRLLRPSTFHQYVRPTLVIFFLLVVGVSTLFAVHSVEQVYQLYARLVYEVQQNMFFVGVLLTFLLWISMNYLQAESRRFVLLVSGLGVYFSTQAVSYALMFLLPGSHYVVSLLPPLAYTLMVSLWLYTFLRVPEGMPATAPRAVRAGPREAMGRL